MGLRYDPGKAWVPTAIGGSYITVDKVTRVAICHHTGYILNQSEIETHCQDEGCDKCYGKFNRRKVDADFRGIRDEFAFPEVIDEYVAMIQREGVTRANIQDGHFPAAIYGAEVLPRSRIVMCLQCFDKNKKISTSFIQNFEMHLKKYHDGLGDKENDYVRVCIMKYRYPGMRRPNNHLHLPVCTGDGGRSVFEAVDKREATEHLRKEKRSNATRGSAKLDTTKWGSSNSPPPLPKQEKKPAEFEPFFIPAGDPKVEQLFKLLGRVFFNAVYNPSVSGSPTTVLKSLGPYPLDSVRTIAAYREEFALQVSLFGRACQGQNEYLLGLTESQKLALRKVQVDLQDMSAELFAPSLLMRQQDWETSSADPRPLGGLSKIYELEEPAVMESKVKRGAFQIKFDVAGQTMNPAVASCCKKLYMFLLTLILNPQQQTFERIIGARMCVDNWRAKVPLTATWSSCVQMSKFNWHMCSYFFATRNASALRQEDRIEFCQNLIAYLTRDGGLISFIDSKYVNMAPSKKRQRGSTGSSSACSDDGDNDGDMVISHSNKRARKMVSSVPRQELSPIEPVDDTLFVILKTIVVQVVRRFNALGTKQAVEFACERFCQETNFSGVYDLHQAVSKVQSRGIEQFRLIPADEVLRLELLQQAHNDEEPSEIRSKLKALTMAELTTHSQVETVEKELFKLNDLTLWLAFLVRLTQSRHTKNHVYYIRRQTRDQRYVEIQNGRVYMRDGEPGFPPTVPWIVGELIMRFAAVVKPYTNKLIRLLAYGQKVHNLNTQFETTDKMMSHCEKSLFGMAKLKNGTSISLGNQNLAQLFDDKIVPLLQRKETGKKALGFFGADIRAKLTGQKSSSQLRFQGEATKLGQQCHHQLFKSRVILPIYDD